jgi:DNA-directed RNA polymerase subunit A"
MLPDHLEKQLKEELKGKKYKDSDITKIRKNLLTAYENSKIAPGEAIGVVTAESFGEPATQMALNVFHMAGVAEMQVTQGLPRLIEIFDARKEPSTPKMVLPIRPKFSRNIDMVRELALKIKETRYVDIAEKIIVNVAKTQIEITLDRKEMRERGLKPKETIGKIEEGVKALKIKKAEGNEVVLKPLDKEISLGDLYRLKEKVKIMVVKGLKGISQVLPIKEDDKYMIHCAGSNLKAALEMEELDSNGIFTNNIFEIAGVLGIEAARQAIIEEAKSVVGNQGLDIDVRHVMFLADVMTTGGVIKGITRTGITGEKESILARASFETPDKHIFGASLTGERDELSSVIENIIINQPIPLGTGLPRLAVKDKNDSK